jgi:hypothetical protein
MLSAEALALLRLHVARHGDVEVDDSPGRPTASSPAPD